MGLVHRPCFGPHLDPWNSQSHGVPPRKCSLLRFHTGLRILGQCISADLGSAFDMVEHMVEHRLGWYDHALLFYISLVSCRANFTGWWASLAVAYVSFRSLRPP